MIAAIVWSLAVIVAVTACWIGRTYAKRNAYWRRMDTFDVAGFTIAAVFCLVSVIGWVR